MRKHRTQEMRSASMTTRLLETTLDCLYTIGYHNTTFKEIEKRTSVSRGAITHHFENKDDLISSALEYLLNSEIENMRIRAEQVSSLELTIDDFIDDLWKTFQGRFFMIIMEFVTIARTKEDLREKFIPLVREYHLSLNEIWKECFQEFNVSDIQIEDYLNLTLVVIRGLAFQSVTKQDEEYFRNQISIWKGIMNSITEQRRFEVSKTR